VNEKLEKALKGAFDAPPPKRKAEFLLSFEYPAASRGDFFMAQLGYIRKRVWVMSALMVAAVMVALHYQGDINVIVWVCASFLPFFVLLGITELAKSMSYNMAELEMSCRYSLSDITLARLGIIGAVNGLTCIILTAVLSRVSGMGLFTFTVQMFTPYLMACCFSLFSLNRFRGKERLYICGGASCFVSVISMVVFNPFNIVPLHENLLFWLFWLSLAWTMAEAIKFIIKPEDYPWNLSLTA